jgi:parallel beta-helix repeat protein
LIIDSMQLPPLLLAVLALAFMALAASTFEDQGLPAGRSAAAVHGPFGTGRAVTGEASSLTVARRRRRCIGVSVPKKARLDVLVERHRRGTTFCIKTGLHRQSAPVIVKPGDRFIGMPGAILSGSRLLTNWTHSRSFWVISGQTQQYIGNGRCSSTHPLCNNANDVFFDDKPLAPVRRLGAVRPGKFFFDYPNDKIYIADNPAGHRLEADVSKGAFSGCYSGACGSSTLISGLIMQHFAGTAVSISDGTVANNEARFNHVAGIAVARDGVIRDNYVHDNGLEGLGSDGDQPRQNLLVEGNETAHNSWYAGYDMGWESGGGKWNGVSGLTLTNNYSHDNKGLGFWVDTDNINVLIANNRIVNNAADGIEYEASFAGTIRNNTITGNGFGLVSAGYSNGWFNGAGIEVAESRDVKVHGNTVRDNYHGIGAMQRSDPLLSKAGYGLHVTANLDVHDNTIRTQHKAAGLIQVINDVSYYTSKNNRFRHNTYILSCTQPKAFAWRDSRGSYYASLTKNQWVAAGNDTTGSFLRRKDCR